MAGDFDESTEEMNWWRVGGCGRNGKLPSCRCVSDVDDDDKYKLVQNTEELEDAFLASDLGELKGKESRDEHSPAISD